MSKRKGNDTAARKATQAKGTDPRGRRIRRIVNGRKARMEWLAK